MLALRDEGQNVQAGSVAPDGRNVLGFTGNQVREYDLITGTPAGPILTQGDKVYDALYSPNARYIVTIRVRHNIRFWERASGHPLSEPLSGANTVWHRFSPDGEYVAVSRMDDTVAVYQLATGKLQGPVLKLSHSPGGAFLGPDGRGFYYVDASGGVQEWDVATAKLVRVLEAAGPVRFIDCVAGKIVVVTGEGSHLARAWDLESGEPRSGSLADLAGNISRLVFSPDGRTILTGLWDRHNARLWDAATGKPIGPPINHGEAVHFVAFTPDGKRMMSISVNGEFRAQDVPSSVSGDSQRIRCWVEVLTGMEPDTQGTIHDLDADALQQRRRRLHELGGPPDGVRL
jgi:WD40 repeat protein